MGIIILGIILQKVYLYTCFVFFQGVKDNKISRSDFEKLWREYLTSNDVNSDGNFLFGPKLE